MWKINDFGSFNYPISTTEMDIRHFKSKKIKKKLEICRISKHKNAFYCKMVAHKLFKSVCIKISIDITVLVFIS